MRICVHWFRRDLRVTDNTALAEAAQRGETVLPVFIVDEVTMQSRNSSARQINFLLRSLESLAKNLEALGHALVIRVGRPEEELVKLCQEAKAEAVFCNKDYEPYAMKLDARVFNRLNAAGIGFESFKDAVIWEEREVATQAGNPYTVFTPYAKAWKSRTLPAPKPRLTRAKKEPPKVASVALPEKLGKLNSREMEFLQPAGESAAQTALRGFMEAGVFEYARQRDFPALNGTSQLSAHFRFGTLGIRTVLSKLQAARAKAEPGHQKSIDAYLGELIWREFYMQVLVNFPHVARGSFRPEYDQLAWSNNAEHLQVWCAGMTGYPIVDAAMRCLNATGWMHNRLRMIVAMFLTKDLLINWQEGERYFMQKLVDGDLAANNGGWQWSAGTGNDAAPYFRIFNPVSQAEKFDPHGAFVRQWVPELASLPGDLIHRPWEAGEATGYPRRIVSHEEQRLKCLAMFKAVKG